MTQQPLKDKQLENLSLQPYENPTGNHIQDEFHKPNLSLDNQSRAQTVDSKNLLVPASHITEQEVKHPTQGSSILSTENPV